jgi:hypothetical protein
MTALLALINEMPPVRTVRGGKPRERRLLKNIYAKGWNGTGM